MYKDVAHIHNGILLSNYKEQNCAICKDIELKTEKEMATHSSILAWRPQGQRSLMGCRLWGHTESDMTETT